MCVVSARDFRSNQGKYLNAANRGEPIVLNSRYGKFKISPITDEDNLTSRICEALKEVKLIESGVLPAKSARTFLDEL